MVSYAIIAHRLMDIEVIIKKTLVFAGLFAMVMGVVALMTTFMQDYLSRFFAISPLAIRIMTAAIAILLYDPTRKFLVNVTDRYLFQKKEDIKVILNRLSQNVITMLDLEKVGQTILSTLQESLRLEAGAIIIKDENGGHYKMLDAFGIDGMNWVCNTDDPFIQIFQQTARTYNLEDSQERQNIPAGLEERLRAFKAVLAIPLFIHRELIGLLLLGKKKSDEEFRQDELDFIPTMAGQVAVALSNARLYDILKKSQIDFAQQAKMAAIGTLSAGIGHEIKNPLNHIKVGIGMLRLNKKHGVLDQLERHALEEEIFKTLDIIDENVTRANEVIERLSSFAKKPKEVKIDAVDMKKAVEMALSFVDGECKYYGIQVFVNFPGEYPMIKADLHSMEDIFLNLLVNARHAIGQQGNILVDGVVTAGNFRISVRDTGSGIKKENIEKIFDPFFTTKDVSRNPDKAAIKGSGLGLFIVRETIQRFGGQIEVESEIGKGTAFHISFPTPAWVTEKVAS